MSDYERLYEALLTLLPDDYKLNFSFLDEMQLIDGVSVPLKNTGALYFRGGPDGRRSVSGDYVSNFTRMTMNLNTDIGSLGVKAGLRYCQAVVKIMDALFNKTIILQDARVDILNCIKQGNYNYLGPNKQGVATFSVNYIIEYI